MEISRVSYCGSLESWPLNRGHFKRKGLSLNFSATLIWLFLLRDVGQGGVIYISNEICDDKRRNHLFDIRGLET